MVDDNDTGVTNAATEEFSDLCSDEHTTVIIKPKLIDLDEVLVEIGEFGIYQIKMIGLCGILMMLMATSSSEYIFTASRINTRCVIPECETQNETHKEFSPAWLKFAIPNTSSGFDQCQRFAPIASSSGPGNETCTSLLFDNNNTVPCDAYVYENTDTIVYDFNLACDEWHRSLTGSARKLGTLFAVPIAGLLSDSYGRRLALGVAVFNTGWVGISRYWASSYTAFMLIEFFESALGAGTIYSCVYVLSTEMSGPKLRIAAGALYNTIFPLGHIVLGLYAWLAPNWRTLTLILYIPQLFGILLLHQLPESARWNISKERHEKAAKTLRKIAKVNKKQVPDGLECSLKDLAMEQWRERESNARDFAKEPSLILLVFRCKSMLVRCIVLGVLWVSYTLLYYGMAINAVNLPISNKYVAYLALFLVEIPGVWLAFGLIDRIGRKPLLVGGFIVCTGTLAMFPILPNDYFMLSLGAFVLGRIGMGAISLTIYTYTLEVFPTKYRHRLAAYCIFMGRFGTIIAPLTPAFGDDVPFILFAILGLICSILVLLLPETLGSKLPDTMEEAVGIRKSTKAEA